MEHRDNRIQLSRRTVILGASALAATGVGAIAATKLFSSLSGASTMPAHNPLFIPPLLEGKNFNLTLSPSSNQFLPGAKTPTYAFNGQSFWGPTLRWKKGDQVSIKVTNHLTETTTTHWHGIHLPAIADGGPHQPIARNTSWSPTFKVKNEAATYWYHPHMHQTTQRQLTMGAGGFIIIDDDSDDQRKLPSAYGVDDIPVVFTSRRFTANNAFDVSNDVAYGDYLLANGVINAAVSVPAQVVRFRLLNAEVERFYNIGFDRNRSFTVIASDGGLLPKPVNVTRLRMAPGERYEILIDLSNDTTGSSLEMKAFNQGMPFGAGGSEPAKSGNFGSALNNTTFTLLHLDVTKPTAKAKHSIPSSFTTPPLWTRSSATKSRTLNITDDGPGTPFTFNGMAYDMMMVNQRVTLNTVESWTVKNDFVFGHAFHLHDVQFAIVSRSTGPIAEYEKGWKDTFAILPNEQVTFVAKFTDYASSIHPYMYHCHMSNHEDGGLMGQFLVVR